MNKLIGSRVYFKDKLTVGWSRIEFQPLNINRGFPLNQPQGLDRYLTC